MTYALRLATQNDAEPVIDILNHYVVTSFAAFPDRPVPYESFKKVLDYSRGYPFYIISTSEGDVVGFGFLYPYRPFDSFNRCAEVGYFLMPEHTGMGVGKQMLDKLVKDALEREVDTLLASISSRNPESIEFHKKNGFEECGRFKSVGRKLDKDFDVVWMQRFI